MALQTQESGVVGLEHNIMDVQGDTKFLPDQSQKNEHGKESNFIKTLISWGRSLYGTYLYYLSIRNILNLMWWETIEEMEIFLGNPIRNLFGIVLEK